MIIWPWRVTCKLDIFDWSQDRAPCASSSYSTNSLQVLQYLHYAEIGRVRCIDPEREDRVSRCGLVEGLLLE